VQWYLHVPPALKLNNSELCYTACYVIRMIDKTISKYSYFPQHHYRLIFVMDKYSTMCLLRLRTGNCKSLDEGLEQQKLTQEHAHFT